MGFIASAATVTSQAYLTELGRQYLFNGPNKPRYVTLPNGRTIDRLKIERFSLGDPDVNYNLPLLLESGEIPDLSGDNENCVTGAKGRSLNNIISPGQSNIPPEDIASVVYNSTHQQIQYNTNLAPNVIPMVVTQQLTTFIDGIMINDGVYTVTPTNYGSNKLNNNELIIPLQEATSTQDGYRLRIIYPAIGSNYNKITFQFEKASMIRGRITTNVTTQIEQASINDTNS